MIIFLYGKDTFRSRQQMKEMVAKFRADRDPQGLNTIVLDCAKGAKNILEQIMATPFLSERRMVVLENFLSFKNPDLQEEILKKIKEKTMPETNVVLFWEETDTYKTKLAKSLLAVLSKEKYAQKFDELKGVQLGNWINNEIKNRGGNISSQAVQYLINHSGSDTWRLNSLINQLIAYSFDVKAEDTNLSPALPYEGKEIEVGDVELFLDEKVDDNIFNLVDAIVAKQSKQVYKMIQEQYNKGEDVQFMFAMILRQFRILLELRDLFEKEDNTQSNILAKKLGLHPFVVKKSLPLVRRYNMEELKNVYKQLLDLDIQIKTGQGKQEMLLDVFVGRVCSLV